MNFAHVGVEKSTKNVVSEISDFFRRDNYIFPSNRNRNDHFAEIRGLECSRISDPCLQIHCLLGQHNIMRKALSNIWSERAFLLPIYQKL